jgi:DNA helicase-2/ATP-dependent DNA helicase PcrA
MERVWSEQQKAIFEWFASGSGNLVVRARAGTGKTTTILEAITHAPEHKVLLAAFNKQIAEELQSRIAHPGAVAKTLHALGFAFVRQNWPKVRVDSKRKWALAKAVLPSRGAPDAVVTAIADLCARARETTPHVGEEYAELLAEANGNFEDEAVRGARKQPVSELCSLAIAAELDVPHEWEDRGWDLYAIAEHALDAVLLAAERTDTIDFSDMIFLPIRNRWLRPSYDLVVVDEAQDMTTAQLELAVGACRKGGRVAVVGDDRQAIYGFRGADSNSIDRLKAELSATELGLTVTYRCPKSVVALAQKLVPDFQAADSAPEGEVLSMLRDDKAFDPQPGDFILSRTNAPLAGICLSLLKEGKAAGLRKLVEKQKLAKLADLWPALGKHIEREASRLEGRVRRDEISQASADAQLEVLHDQREVLYALSDDLETTSELLSRLQELFSDNDLENTITCSTVHRAKGLESDRVYILKASLYTKAGELREGREEENIRYVAITRSKRSLVWLGAAPTPRAYGYGYEY